MRASNHPDEFIRTERVRMFHEKQVELEDEGSITVGHLKEALRGYSDETWLYFGTTNEGNPQVFLRVKDRGSPADPRPVIELSEIDEDDVWDALFGGKPEEPPVCPVCCPRCSPLTDGVCTKCGCDTKKVKSGWDCDCDEISEDTP